MYADWTDRIAAGELPAAEPSRPQGKERNVVVTMWDWADPKVYLHDEIASDKRNPDGQRQRPDLRRARRERRLSARSIDPKTHTRVDDQAAPFASRTRRAPSSTPPAGPSPYWGDEAIWNSQTTVHSFAMDKQARVWAAARVRKPADAGVVPSGIGSSVRKALPDQSGAARPEHVRPEDQAAHDHRHVLHVGPRELRRQRRALVIVRTGGRRGLVRHTDLGQDARREAGAGLERVRRSTTTATASATPTPSRTSPPIPTKDKRLNVQFYGDSPANRRLGVGIGPGHAGRARPLRSRRASAGDGAVGGTTRCRGTTRSAKVQGFAPRGMDIDSKNVVWTVLSSGHLASFDRSKCKGPLNGPTRDRTALPRRLDAPHAARARTTRAQSRTAAPTRRTTTSSIASTCSARQGRSAGDGQPLRRAARARRRQVPDAARAVSDGVLLERAWTAASTIRRAAGRARASTRRSRPARRSTWKAARARRAS